jgi:hypothetical protein
MMSMDDIILERSRHAAVAAQWLRGSVRLEVMVIRRLRELDAPDAIATERIGTLWREYKLANKMAVMNAKHIIKMAAVQRDIEIMKGIVQ